MPGTCRSDAGWKACMESAVRGKEGGNKKRKRPSGK